jgi:hypothetical protein
MKHHLTKLNSKPLSWSAISSWTYSQEQWAKKYLEGIYEEPNEVMKFGNEVGNRLGTDRKYLPKVERYEIMYPQEHRLVVRLELVGLFDSYDPVTHNFYEYKTSSNKDKWTQKSAEEHGQIMLYLFLIWKTYNVPPEKIKIKLFYIPVSTDGDFKMKVHEKGIKEFEIKHTTLEVLRFMGTVMDTYKEMCKFALDYKK